MPKEETQCTLIRYLTRSLACTRRIRIRIRMRKRISKRIRIRIGKRVIGYRSHVVWSRYLYIKDNFRALIEKEVKLVSVVVY
jgi:hypothetical protein